MATALLTRSPAKYTPTKARSGKNNERSLSRASWRTPGGAAASLSARPRRSWWERRPVQFVQHLALPAPPPPRPRPSRWRSSRSSPTPPRPQTPATWPHRVLALLAHELHAIDLVRQAGEGEATPLAADR